MLYRLLADLTVAVHFFFMLFVAFGALFVFWRKWALWLHLPAACWGVFIELSGSVCPLTPLENRLRETAGLQGYQGGFIEHYLLPVLYPEGLTEAGQVVIGTVVLLVNVAIYGWLLWRRERKEG